MSSMQVEVVESQAAFSDLRDDWHALHDISAGATLCNTWEWCSVWWDVYKQPGWTLKILVFRAEGQLAGIAPLYEKNRFSHSELWFLGSGEPERDEVASEYVDFLVAPEMEASFRDQGWQLLESVGDWDSLHAPNVLPDSFVIALHSARNIRSPAGQRYRVRLPESWAKFLAERGSNMRRKIQQSRKDIAALHSEERVARHGTNEKEPLFDHLTQLHKARWTSKGIAGAFDSTFFRDFHQKILYEFSQQLGCELRVTFADEKPLCALYNFRLGDTVYFYQSGIAADSVVRSPGILAHSYAIESAIQHQFAYYDLMRGDKDSYKNRFRCEVTEMQNIVHYRNSNCAHLLYVLRVAKMKLRKLLM